MPVRLRILVIDDQKDVADTTRILLELFGHAVAVAYSGEEAVKRAVHWQPDVVLCDIGLPELDGFGVARTLRRTAATADARLIAITAFGREEDRRRGHEAGFDHYLVKPADPQQLLRLVAASVAS